MVSREKPNQKHLTHHNTDFKCLEPFQYLNQNPGKDVRGTLIDCFQEWFEIPHEKLILIKEIISSLHTASLLVDDIEDGSKQRRGRPVAHSIYGIPQTLNCANYVYFLSLEKCYSLKSTEAMNVYIQELLNLHRGQGQDILWRDTHICPSESEYKQMVLDKTGGLFRLAMKLMQVFSTKNKHTDFVTLCNLLSLYFQIRDDYLNLFSATFHVSKSYAEDLTEGKFSYPIIHSIHQCNIHSRTTTTKTTENNSSSSSNASTSTCTHLSADSRLLNILKQHTEDVTVKKYAIDYMKELHSDEYTLNTLNDLYQQVHESIASYGGHKLLSLLITQLHDALIAETHKKRGRAGSLRTKPMNKTSKMMTKNDAHDNNVDNHTQNGVFTTSIASSTPADTHTQIETNNIDTKSDTMNSYDNSIDNTTSIQIKDHSIGEGSRMKQKKNNRDKKKKKKKDEPGVEIENITITNDNDDTHPPTTTTQTEDNKPLKRERNRRKNNNTNTNYKDKNEKESVDQISDMLTNTHIDKSHTNVTVIHHRNNTPAVSKDNTHIKPIASMNDNNVSINGHGHTSDDTTQQQQPQNRKQWRRKKNTNKNEIE